MTKVPKWFAIPVAAAGIVLLYTVAQIREASSVAIIVVVWFALHFVVLVWAIEDGWQRRGKIGIACLHGFAVPFLASIAQSRAIIESLSIGAVFLVFTIVMLVFMHNRAA